MTKYCSVVVISIYCLKTTTQSLSLSCQSNDDLIEINEWYSPEEVQTQA